MSDKEEKPMFTIVFNTNEDVVRFLNNTRRSNRIEELLFGDHSLGMSFDELMTDLNKGEAKT